MEKLETLPKEPIFTYLGYRKDVQMLTSSVEKLVEDSIREILEVASPKVLSTKPIPIEEKNQKLYLGNLELIGTDIKAHLEHCHSAILMAITLGTAVDRIIQTAEWTDVAKAVVLDSTANVAIEQYADRAEEEIRKALLSKKQYLTMRFSPGYGDLPIETQKPLLKMLEADKKIGLTLTKTNLMIPKKSITAVLGVADIAVTGKLAGCAHCVLKNNCMYKKRGTTCANP